MPSHQPTTAELVDALTATVDEAAAYFASLDESARDGDQTLHQVLAHIVFWHREYVRVIRAIVAGRPPHPLIGKYYEFNQHAYQEFQNVPRRVLTKRLIRLQSDLGKVAVRVPSQKKFEFKVGSQPLIIAKWLPRIQAHIRGHAERMRQAERKNKRTL